MKKILMDALFKDKNLIFLSYENLRETSSQKTKAQAELFLCKKSVLEASQKVLAK